LDKLIIIGPAGSGKSTLTKAFGRWLEDEGHSVSYVNLDPGARYISFKPTFDVRGFANVEDIMKREGLAPNGALIRASEVLEDSLSAVIEAIENTCVGSGFCIIDTPGQMELFLFRSLGPIFTRGLKGRALSIFVMDPSLLKSSADLVVLKLLDLLVELRLGLPSLEVINKSDLIGNVGGIEGALEESYKPSGISAELAEQLDDVIRGLSKRRHAIFVSALDGKGMDDLYKAICESRCACGDMG
jgi:hypothetical protein